MEVIILTVISILLIIVLVWTINDASKKVKNEWKRLRELQEMFNEVETLEELIEFHDEFREFANKINNEHIQKELVKLDGIIRGMFRVLKKQKNNGIENSLQD